MSGYYLCTAKRAAHPFYIESVDLRIYSIEELCYYLRENVYLIDEGILSEKLCAWFHDEIGLTKLSATLRRALAQGKAASSFVLPIFEECGYLTFEEQEYFREQLTEMLQEPAQVRRKMKADTLVGHGRYLRALEEYGAVMAQKNIGRMGIQFYAVVLENMATVYANMFLFEEAADCLWESYQTLKSKKIYEKYLRLLPLFLSEQAWRERLAEIRADRDEADRLRRDNEALFAEAQDSAAAERWQKKSIAEQIEMVRAEYVC